MTHFELFALEIASVVLVGLDFDGHLLGHTESVALRPNHFFRVVGQQAHLAHTDVDQHLCADAVVAHVILEPQLQVGFHRVHALAVAAVRRP
jgi:hypothetical protein